MAGRGQQTFNKRQKEQQRKERQQEKIASRIQRKKEGGLSAQIGPEDGEMSLAQQLAAEPPSRAEQEALSLIASIPNNP